MTLVEAPALESTIHTHGHSLGATGSCTAAELCSRGLVTDYKPEGKKNKIKERNKSLVRCNSYIFFCNIIRQAVTVICLSL